MSSLCLFVFDIFSSTIYFVNGFIYGEQSLYGKAFLDSYRDERNMIVGYKVYMMGFFL